VSPDDGGVQHHPFQVRFGGHGLEHLVQHTHPDPAVIALLGPLKRAEPLRKIAPSRPGPGHPQQSVDEQPPIAARAALALAPARHKRLDPSPLIVPKNLAFQSRLQKAALNQNYRFRGILNRHYDLGSVEIHRELITAEAI